MDADVRAWRDGAPGPERRSLWLSPWLADDAFLVVQAELDKAILFGAVRTWDDWRATRVNLLRTRMRQGRSRAAAFSAVLEREGLEPLELDPVSGRVRVDVDRATLARLVREEVTASVQRPEDPRPDGSVDFSGDGGVTIDGIELAALQQTQAFYDAGYEGQGIQFAVVESGAPEVFRNHLGFRDGNGNRRFRNCQNWSWDALSQATTCDNVQPPRAQRGIHATAVAGLLLGDVTRGQDWVSGLDFTEQRQRSGVARLSWGWGFEGPLRVLDAFDLLQDFNPAATDPLDPSPEYQDITIISRSASDSNTGCQGSADADERANFLFESGFAFFNSTSNDNGVGGGSCTLGAPASALGVFAVNVHVINSQGVAVPNGNTSSADDGRRSIIGLTGPAPTRFAYPHYNAPWVCPESFASSCVACAFPWGAESRYQAAWQDADVVNFNWDCSTGATGPLGDADWTERGFMFGSSGATPMVAGAAGVFQSFYLNEIGTGILDPGVLYASMLLMGNRATPSGSFDTIGFDNRFGAGELELTLPSTDLELGFQAGSVCLGQNETVELEVSDDGLKYTMPASVDYLKVVAWTYSSDHDDDGDFPEVDLGIKSCPGGPTIWNCPPAPNKLDDSTDNKKRIFLSSTQAAGFAHHVVLSRGDKDGAKRWPTCPAGKVKVWYAWMWEDEDRWDRHPVDDREVQ